MAGTQGQEKSGNGAAGTATAPAPEASGQECPLPGPQDALGAARPEAVCKTASGLAAPMASGRAVRFLSVPAFLLSLRPRYALSWSGKGARTAVWTVAAPRQTHAVQSSACCLPAVARIFCCSIAGKAAKCLNTMLYVPSPAVWDFKSR